MKHLRWWIFALLAGELLAIFRTDKKFTKELHAKTGREKLTFVVERLFTFNKDLLIDTKESIQNFDLKENVEHVKSFVQKEIEVLKGGLRYAEENLENLKEDKLLPMLDQLRIRFDSLTKVSSGLADERVTKLGLKSALEEIQKQLDKLSNNATSKKTTGK